MTYASSSFFSGKIFHRLKERSLREDNSVGAITFATLMLLALFGTSSTGWGTPQVTVTYGSNFIGETGVFFTDSSQAGFDGSNPGVIAVGYFNSGFDVQTEAQRLVSDNLPDFLTNFNILASSSFQDASSPGYYTAQGQFPEQSVGAIPYLLTLSGISSLNDVAGAVEIGLFSDFSLPVLPEGGDPVPATYDLAITLTFDDVLLGTGILESTLLSGNAYTTTGLSDLPTIWGGATDLGDNWLHLSWLGFLFREPASEWAYHYQLGWIYPSGTDPDGFWIWCPEWNSWAFTGTSIFPRLWLNAEQKWIWVELHDTGTFTTQIHDSTTNQWQNYNSID
jgi:hypothetical protein